MMQTANVAQSIYQMVPQASMYIPITTAPRSPPSYLSNFDASSKWHTSALQVAAIESITLPSRLRSRDPARASLSDFETTISNDGKRRIAQLDYSVADPASLSGAAANGHSGNDSRVNGNGNGHATNGHSYEDDDPTQPAELDIDMTPYHADPSSSSSSSSTRQAQRSKGTVFGQSRTMRGKWKSTLEIEETNIAARDRFSSGPRMQDHQSSLLFPVIDSFPSLFDFGGRGARPKEVAVRASLSTSSGVAKRIRELERASRWLLGVEDREALTDGLIGIAEEYEEGWSSGEEDEDDE